MLRNKKRPRRGVFRYLLAERAGFEPAVGYEPTHAFQACDLNHSSTFPRRAEYSRLACSPSHQIKRYQAAGGALTASPFTPAIMLNAEPMRVDTSVILLGTMRVVLAAWATWP